MNGLNKDLSAPRNPVAGSQPPVNHISSQMVYEAVTITASPSETSLAVNPQASASSRV
jgi:hypothetical protein